MEQYIGQYLQQFCCNVYIGTYVFIYVDTTLMFIHVYTYVRTRPE